MTMSSSSIPDRFYKVIALHLIKNLMSRHGYQVPLILGIHGPTGSGKTYQCEQILSELGVGIFLISGGQLESPKAGEPAQLIRTTYIAASDSNKRNPLKSDQKIYPLAVIIINDIDTALGEWQLTQYSMNRQIVYEELMNLTDHPNEVEGRMTRRIPVILTGNDFTKLYPPLVRPGRMTTFEWKPTAEEKVLVVSHILPELNQNECKSLVDEFFGQQVSFFSDLSSLAYDQAVWDYATSFGISYFLNELLNGKRVKLGRNITYSHLRILAIKLAESSKFRNHLESTPNEATK